MNRREFLKMAAVAGAAGALASTSGCVRQCLKESESSDLRRPLGKTGFRVFPVIYGGIVSMSDGQEASDRYVAWARERGVNYFDVAPTYGDAQEKLGVSLRPCRKDIYLACKTACRKRAEAEPEFENSFRMLHTDWFDVYQLHALSSEEDVEAAFTADGVMPFLIAAKRAGRIRKLGFTAHSEQAALKALSLYDFDTVMFPVNWQLEMGAGIGRKLEREIAARGIGLLGMKSLVLRAWRPGEQKDSGYPKSWCKPIDPADEALALAALRYTFAAGADVLVPPGNFKSFSFVVEHIREVLAQPLSPADESVLLRELALVRNEPFFTPDGRSH